jgi:Co/Zn/Cd efflux system component
LLSLCQTAIVQQTSNPKKQQRVLVILLTLNAALFVTGIVPGIIIESTGLTADSLDMLADATVYAIGLYAVGKAATAIAAHPTDQALPK